MVKHAILTLVMLSLSTLSIAQPDAVQRQINEQLWKPFSATYAALDAPGFSALHTPDVVRIIRDAGTILTGAGYRTAIAENFNESRTRNLRRSIEFRFTERFVDGDIAFESGYYKIISRYGEQEEYTFYGQFDVVLRQENGRWKIAVDTDTSKRGALSEADFQQGRPME